MDDTGRCTDVNVVCFNFIQFVWPMLHSSLHRSVLFWHFVYRNLIYIFALQTIHRLLMNQTWIEQQTVAANFKCKLCIYPVNVYFRGFMNSLFCFYELSAEPPHYYPHILSPLISCECLFHSSGPIMYNTTLESRLIFANWHLQACFILSCLQCEMKTQIVLVCIYWNTVGTQVW